MSEEHRADEALIDELTEKLRPLRADPDAAWMRLQAQLQDGETRAPRSRLIVGALGGLAVAAAALLGIFGLGAGQDQIITAAGQSQTLAVAELGTVTLGPNSELWVKETDGVPEFNLKRGALHAVVDAPPRVFAVRTPAAKAIDLGCVYDLSVEKDQSTQLVVHVGAVALAAGQDEVFVPEGHAARAADGVLGPPVRHDAAPAFQSAAWSTVQNGRDEQVENRWDALLSLAGPADLETLLFFAARAHADERKPLEDWFVRTYSVPFPQDGLRGEILSRALRARIQQR